MYVGGISYNYLIYEIVNSDGNRPDKERHDKKYSLYRLYKWDLSHFVALLSVILRSMNSGFEGENLTNVKIILF